MNVIDAAYNVVHDYPGGAESLGPRVEKNPTTLSHEVAEVGTAKLGLKTAVKLTAFTKDYRILEAFAAQCGRMVLPMPEVLASDGDECLKSLGEVLRESGEVVRELTGSLEDGNISDNEYGRIAKECGHLVSAATNLLAAVRARNAAGKPASAKGGVA
ncbi:phage regulatory CII family protein [Acidovorax sp.]|uniref:phage regulatory CII family protein n=1 Tax=Acidovorax sp. TaxID=1872122 RepID=UPI003CFC8B21